MSTATIDPARERGVARAILGGRRYRGAPVPRPLHGLLRWLDDRLSPVTRWIGDRFSWLPASARPWLQVAALAAVALVVAFAIRALVRARARAARVVRAGPAARAAGDDDPGALEAAAAEAEARGEHALAVRLRFRAGLLRLDRDAHAIAYRPSIPTGAVRTELASPAFDELADTFEDIAYGGSPGDAADTTDARREWPRVVDAARRR